jgi:hypothetical protein
MSSMSGSSEQLTDSQTEALERGTAAAGSRWPQLSPLFRIVDRVVYWSDTALTVPGTKLRFGLDPIIGMLFPGGGDAVGGVVSLSVLLLALQNRLPVWVLGRMVLNIAIDAGIGSVPFLGDLFDFGFRANQRNMNMLRAHSARPLPASVPKLYWLWGILLLLLALALATVPIVLGVWAVAWLFTNGR